MSLRWPDLHLGQEFQSRTRTITEADVVAFAGLTGDYSEIHMSESFAAAGDFGGRIAHGLLVLSYAHGMMLGGGLLADCAVAFLGMSEWRFRGSVHLGDTIQVKFRVGELRKSRSLEHRGILTFDVEIVNQHGAVVQSGRKSLLLSTEAAPRGR
ncbi:MaoC/PaaZ C-terminal domain-containing protein [Nonomuraea insulae]|uniref:MaoC/PaaZ C-terminal domain-containing protein n=1 Tax=Nonomuraea insulae TaxID=1616787 RepID=A0ABW1DAV2_9ACTN